MNVLPTRAIATASATLSNIGPGFDVLGLCLEGPRDEVIAERMDRPGVVLTAVEGDGGLLPRQAAKNCVGVAAQQVLESFGPKGAGVSLRLVKGLPVGSGLGSSAASSVASAVATAALFCPEIEKMALLDACRAGEHLATGQAHPDNVAPSLLGGMVACMPRYEQEDSMYPWHSLEVVQLPTPPGLHVAWVKPNVEVSTAEARALMPKAIPIEDVVCNLAWMAGLVTGLAKGDEGLIARSLDDRVATPYRKAKIPAFDAVMGALKEAGAMAGGISGSGPTMFAFASARELGLEICAAMQQAFREHGVDSLGAVSTVDSKGATVRLEA
jgi:homoserine kinase